MTIEYFFKQLKSLNYTYENMDLRMFPGIQRDAKEWADTYKIKTIVERAINHFKLNIFSSN